MQCHKKHENRIVTVEMSQSFIVFDAQLPWIYPLVYELGRFGPSVAINLGVSQAWFHRRVVKWPYVYPDDEVRKEVWSYPPGFNRKLGFIFDRPIRARLAKIIRGLKRQTGEIPYVILPNPRLFQYVEEVDPSHLIYINYDDYSVSFDARGRAEIPAEEKLVGLAGTVLCSSAYQVFRFKERFPACKSKIFHFPHGVHEAFLNPAPDQLSAPPTVCISGRLTSRYDWQLIEEVVARLPAVRFVFVGVIETVTHCGQSPDWLQCLQRVLGQDNVRHQEVKTHLDSRSYYWESVINWMPYKPDLPFVKASCPLKISDGLASGRAVLSADVPECRLYPEWISVYQNANEAVALISDEIKRMNSPTLQQRRKAQFEFARHNTWADRAQQLVEILGRDVISGRDAQEEIVGGRPFGKF